MDVKKFEEDLKLLISRLGAHPNLIRVKDKLIELRVRGLVKSNHSVLEVLVADYLFSKGFEVTVEHKLTNDLVCDVYADSSEGDLIVEVETGFVPPHYSLEPRTYNLARVISKVARYSRFSKYFGLAVPSFLLLQLHPYLIKPPRERELSEALELKAICDKYYTNPPVTLKEISSAKVDVIYVLDVDELSVEELTPLEYYRMYIAPISRNNGWSFRARRRSPGPT